MNGADPLASTDNRSNLRRQNRSGFTFPAPNQTEPPPDPKNQKRHPGGNRDGETVVWIAGKPSENTNSTTGDSASSRPRLIVESFSGSCLFATVLRLPNGTTDRPQVFADHYASARCARKLDAAFAGCRS